MLLDPEGVIGGIRYKPELESFSYVELPELDRKTTQSTRPRKLKPVRTVVKKSSGMVFTPNQRKTKQKTKIMDIANELIESIQKKKESSFEFEKDVTYQKIEEQMRFMDQILGKGSTEKTPRVDRSRSVSKNTEQEPPPLK